jgi:MFS family permease
VYQATNFPCARSNIACRTFTCISVVPLAGTIVKELDHGSPRSSAAALLVTIWELGEAAGPLLIAPLSEVFGRYPVMNVCNILFIIATILAALSQSTGALIAFRAMTGLAVASNVLNPAIIGDIYESEQRGSPMSLLILAPLIGGAVGPAISGAIADTLGWREVLFIAAGMATVCELLFLFFLRETYKMTILRRRLAKLANGNVSHTTQHGHEDVEKIWTSIARPAAVLYSSGVLVALSLFGSIAFSYFYVISITLPDILHEIYGFSLASMGSAFMTFSAGSAIGVLICNQTLDRIYMKLSKSREGGPKPEYRLPIVLLGASTMPVAIAAYGWVVHFRLPVAYLLVANAMLGLTLTMVMIPLSAYVVDACGQFAASAMTGVIVTRCLMGTFLPLAVSPLTLALGYGWGFTVLGAVSMAVGVLPVLVFRYGEQWRMKSKYTRDA